MNELKPLPLSLPGMLGVVLPRVEVVAAPLGTPQATLPETPPVALPSPSEAVPLPRARRDRPLARIPRSNLKGMTVKFLKDQGGLCPLCGKPIDLRIAREGVVDHDHNTGEVRGVLHRGCNGAEGKVANAVGRWTGLGMDYEKIVPWLENLVAYLKREGTGYMYPTHKSEEEKAAAAKLKRRTQRAQKQARIKVRSMKKEG